MMDLVNFLKKLGESILTSEDLPRYEFDEEKVRMFLSKLPAYIKVVLIVFVIILNFLPLLRIFSGSKPKTFSSMNVDERRKLVEKWLHSRISFIRNSLLVLKLLALFFYAEREDVKKVVGCLVPIPKKRVKKPKFPEDSVIEFSEDVGMLKVKCDVVVIGSGAGGSVVAKELSERGFRVILIEEGFMPNPKGDILESLLTMYRNFGFDLTLPKSPSQPLILLPSGKCLGGTTVINEGTCFRTPDTVIEKWNSEFGLDIDLEDLHNYFDRVEKTINAHRASLHLIGKASAKIISGCEKLGYSYSPLKKNVAECEALGLCEFGCPIDAKRAMNISYLPLATASGAKIYTGLKVTFIDFKGEKITKIGGYILNREGRHLGKFSVEANYFVLSAGAIQTPHILLKNGVANSSGLVGKNLHIHPCFALMGIFEERLEGWKSISQSVCVDEFLEEGILFESTFLPFGIGLANNFLPNVSELIRNWDKIAILGVMLSDEDSNGSVRPLGDKPIVFYSLGKKDLQKAQKALVEGCRILFSAGAKKVITPAYNFPLVEDLNQIKKIVPNGFVWSAYHPQGTCRMGGNPFYGVVDSYGRTYDFDNLYIADASIFPTSVKVNPMLSIMGFAMRTAERISEARG